MLQKERYVTWTLILVVLLIAVFYQQDFGITWDESVHAQYADLVADYFVSGGENTECNRFINLYYYGSFFDLIPSVVSGGHGVYDIRHLFSALLIVFMIPALVGFLRPANAWALALFSVVALFMMPRFTGHSVNNLKDIPFAITVTWFMAQISLLFYRGEFKWRQIVTCGVALGLALCARPGGLPLLLCYLLAAAMLRAAWCRWFRMRRDFIFRKSIRSWAICSAKTLVLVLIGWFLMVLFWPWSHSNVFLRPLEAMKIALSFNYQYENLFEGKVVSSNALPWYYMMKYLIVTTPPSLLFITSVGLFRSLYDGALRREKQLVWVAALAIIWVAIPILGFVIQRPHVYGGIRHFLFVLPSIATLAGIGGLTIWQRIVSRNRMVAWILVACLLLLPLREIRSLHPYQSSYFNVLVGGIKGASGRYAVDYWASSYREGMLWINQQARRTPQRIIRVLVAGDGFFFRPCADYYSDKNVRVILSMDVGAGPIAVDYYLATTHENFHLQVEKAPVVHRVEREGAVLAVVKKVSGAIHLRPRQ